MKNDNILSVMKKAFGGTYNTISSGRGRWSNWIEEPFSGAWQRNLEASREDMLSYPAVFACVTLIANDISKLNLKLVKKDENGIWSETESPSFSPVLKRPNKYQNRIQFINAWILSLLIHGNTYVLKVRDQRNVVVSMHILDPLSVVPCLADDGSLWYDIPADQLRGENQTLRVPDTEIIHDRANTIYSHLYGVSPLYAAALSVGQGRQIQKNSATLHQNNSRPGGILEAAGAISDETAEQLRKYWADNYTGNNAGKVAVLADGLSYKSFDVQTAANAQVIEQLKWSSEVVAMVFHVPPYKIGVGATTGSNIESENIRYFSEALQIRISSIELLMKEGLNLSSDLGVRFDLEDLFKMDTKTMIETQEIAVGAGIKEINEARKIMNLPPIEGGDTAYLQQQNFSIKALARRDASENPFGNSASSTNTNNNTNETEEPTDEEDQEVERFISELRIKTAERFIYAK